MFETHLKRKMANYSFNENKTISKNLDESSPTHNKRIKISLSVFLVSKICLFFSKFCADKESIF